MVKQILLIVISVIVAMALLILPLPTWLVWLRPEWVLLVIIYWLLVIPENIGIGIAWSIGLLVDILQGTLFGEHALVFAAVGYFIVKFHKPMTHAAMRGQILIVLLLILLYQVLLLWIQGLIGQLPNLTLYWLAAFTSTLLWPWIYWLLNDIRMRIALNDKVQIDNFGHMSE